jgi:mannose-1-phosphate guanylyltransferase
MTRDNTWAVVLAAGDGTRLARLTTDHEGIAVPKQYCTLDGDGSLLDVALRRAGQVVPAERLCTIVAARHRHYWQSAAGMLQASHIIEQPENRGTAHGILLAVLWVLQRDPGARIIFFPADHYVQDEPLLARSLRQAVSILERNAAELLLIGIEPEMPDPELGYIVPGLRRIDGSSCVAEFVEKPDMSLASRMVDRGALWNSFIFGVGAMALLRMLRERMPETVTVMRAALRVDKRNSIDSGLLAMLYERLASVDFSRSILQGNESSLRVLKAPACGWTDLGPPVRVADTLRRLSRERQRPSPATAEKKSFMNLAIQHAQLQAAG